MENLKIKSIYHFNKNEIEYLTEKYQLTKAVAVHYLGRTKFTLDEKGNVSISGESPYGVFDKEQWKNVKKISCGKNHIVGLKNDGTVVAYGDNSNGQCNVQDWRGVMAVDTDGDKTTGFTKNGMLETQKEEVIFPEEEIFELKRPTRNNTVGAALGSSNSALKNNVKSENIDAQGKCGENSSYKLIGNTLYIDGTGTLDAKTLAEGSTVFHTSRFRYLPNKIKNVIISDGITKIGDYAFCDCTSLESITIPSSVTKIGDNAFYGCKALEVITIPRSVTYIGKSAFYYCDNLTINGEAGSYAQRYKKDFEADTFKNSDNSKKIKPNTKAVVIAAAAVLVIVGAVGSIIAFGNSNSKVKNNVNSVNSAIQTNTKAAKSSLDYDGQTSATETTQNIDAQGECGANASYRLIGNTLYIDGTGTVDVKTLEEGSSNYTSHFRYLPNEIENVIIADGITEVGDYAFDSCKSLKNITIPDSVIGIDNYAFYGCISLESITIPSSVNQIGEWAFDNCTSLKSIKIPSSVTEIGRGAFWKCRLLESITLPSSVTEIGRDAFESCTSLESITIPSSITKIGIDTFKSCTSLESITIPSSVTEIDDTAFEDCDNVTIHGEAGSYAETYAKENNISFANSYSSNAEKSNIDAQGECGANASYKLMGNTLYIDGTGTVDGDSEYKTSRFESLSNKIKNVIIEDGITEIGYKAFGNCTSLESITIPSSVKKIGEDAFWRCKSLESITIPSSVKEIVKYAFAYCDSLKNITIPSSVKEIGNGVFAGCTSLESITIPSSVTVIGGYTFKECKALKSITIPSSVTKIGQGAFEDCTSLESITIPSSVTEISDYSYVFKNCDNVTIHGKAGSYAETYANEHNISFKSI